MEEKRAIAADNIFFRKLVEYSHEGISLIDSDFKVIYRSPSAQRVNGYGEVDSSNSDLPLMIHPADIQMVQALLIELLADPGSSRSCSFRCKHAQGHYIWLACTYTNMFHEPEVNAIVCNFRDISKQKESEAQLERSIKELSAYKYALDEADIVAITDQRGIITHVNDNFCRISKYSRSELIGKDHRVINSSFHSKDFIRDLWVTIANGKIWKNEMKNKAKDGTFYWVDTTIIPFLSEQGKPYQYLAIRSDITERKQVEEKIVESGRFIKTITDSLPAMISYWTAELNCHFANNAMLSWFDKTPEQMYGINKRQLMDTEDLKQYMPYIKGVLKGEPQNFERSFSKENGKTIYTYTQYVPDLQNGKVVGFYSLIFDYSDVRVAELEIVMKNAQIENLLDNITDGFIALDENRRYTYANKQIGQLLGVEPSSLIGQHIWELFPDVIGSPTYLAIEEAFAEHKYICHEDYYSPLDLWQENRIYPSGNHLSIFIRDVSQRKKEEALKSMITSIGGAFSEEVHLEQSLRRVLELLAGYGGFELAECWLIEVDQNNIGRVAEFSSEKGMEAFFGAHSAINFIKGQGLPGIAWERGEVLYWQDLDQNSNFLRTHQAKAVGLKAAYGLPLRYRDRMIGVLLLGSSANDGKPADILRALETVGQHLGSEIRRKQLEQELNQIFNFTPDILCTVHIDGYFKKVNPAMCALLEYSEAELLSTQLLHFIHPAFREAAATELTNISAGRPAYYIENRYITKSGKSKWLAWTTTAASAQGLVYCSAKDVTDKKELEELLHKATQLARIGAWEVDLPNEKVNWSQMTCEIHETPAGFTPDMQSGINFYAPGSREQISEKIQQMTATGQGFDLELQIVTAKGKTKWVRVVGEAEFLAEQCVRIYGSFQDIDNLKRTELIAKEILEERNNILESIGDAFFAVDQNWVITYWNSTAEQVLQKTKEDMIDHNLWEVFAESIDSESYHKYHEAIALNQAVHFEDHYARLDRWYEISAYPTGNGLSVYFKDITSRKTSDMLLKDLNLSLHKQAKELATSNTELEQFAYVASHDLQEPLRMITSFLTQLELKYGDIVDERGKKYIHFAVDGAKRMRQIILDLLEFSRVGRNEDSLEEVDLGKIIKDVLVLYRKQIQEKNAIVRCSKMPVLVTYKVPMRQIFQNLISNSLKYQGPGTVPRIQITCKDIGSYWQFMVSDNGIGIDREYFEKIFIIFQRLHNKEDYAGTGMGLAITKKIIENMGGRIWLESAEGKGSKFYFTISKEQL